jgi:hypothetical protein
MPPDPDPVSRKPPDRLFRPTAGQARTRRDDASRAQLAVSQHGPVLTPGVLTVLYDIIAATRTPTTDRNDGDQRAS